MVVEDILPVGVAFVSSISSVGSYASGTGLWSVGTLTNGASETLALIAQVTASGVISNIVQVNAVVQADVDSTPDNDIPSEDDQDSAAITVPQQVDLRLGSIVNDATPTINDNIVYTITLTNDGPDSASSVVVEDILPAGLAFVSSVPSVGSYDSGTGLWTVGTLANSASATLAITAQVTASGVINNIVQVNGVVQADVDSTPNNDNPAEDDQDSVSIMVAAQADLTINNTDASSTYTPGTTRTYSLTLSNLGVDTAVNAVVTNTAPAGSSIANWTCIANGGATCPNASGGGDILETIPTLNNGGSLTYSVDLTIPSNFLGNLVNSASIASDTDDATLANNTSSDMDTANNINDLAIIIHDGETEYSPGASHENYTVVLTNSGASDAYGSNVTVGFSAGVVVSGWTCLAQNGAFICPNTSGSGAINETFVNFPVGASATYTLSVSIPANQTGNLVASAAVITAGDSNGANDNATDIDTLNSEVDYAITIDDATSLYPPGGSTIYNVVVSNLGPSDGSNATVIFNAPVNSNISAWSCSAAGGVSCENPAGVGNINEVLAHFPNAAQLQYSVTLAIDVGRTGNLTANANVSTTDNDTNGANDISSDIDTDAPSIDLSLSLDDSVTEYVAGQSVTYTLFTQNEGNSDASNATISLSAPSNTTISAWTCSDGTTVTCASAGGVGDINEVIGAFPSGDSLTYAVTLAIDSDISGNLVTNATISTTDTEANLANNINSDIDIANNITDYAITIDDGVSLYLPGGNLLYTIVASNNGPSDGTNATISVVSLDGASVLSWTCIATGGVVCPAASGTGAPNENFTDFPVAATVTYSALVQVDSGKSDDLLTTINITSTDTEAIVANNTASDIDANGGQADLRLNQSVNNSTPYISDNIVYTITLTNDGPASATNVLVEDVLPSGVAFISSSASIGSYASSTGLWTVGTLANGASATLAITAQVTASGVISNIAQVNTVTEADPDSSLDNDTLAEDDQDSVNITVAEQADLTISTTDTSDIYIAGTNITYTVTVTNAGPGDAVNLVITDITSTGTTVDSWTCTASAGASCATASGTGDLGENLPLLVNGGSLVYSVTASIPASFTGDLVNTATVVSDTHDSITTNDNDADINLSAVSADLAITQADNETVYSPGTSTVYTVVVANLGPSDATNVVVIDTPPTGTTIIGWSCTGTATFSCPNASGQGNLTEIVPMFSAGESITFTVELAVPIDFIGDLTHLATVSSDTTEANSDNNSATDINKPITADVTVSITDNEEVVWPNSAVVYSIEVSNQGPGNATNILASDIAPVGTTITSWHCDNSQLCPNTQGIGDLNETIPLLLNGEVVSYQVTLSVPRSFIGELTNVVNITSENEDPDLENNSDLDTNILQSCSVEGAVFEEQDFDNLLSTADLPFAKRQVQLMQKGADKLWQTNDDTLVATTMTDEQGLYSFIGSYCGEFVIKVIKPSEQFNDALLMVDVKNGIKSEINFPYIDPAGVVYDALSKALIADAKVSIYNDLNNNNIVDATDLLVYQHVTLADGKYAWLLGSVGDYLITIDVPAESDYSWVSKLIPPTKAAQPLGNNLNDVRGLSTGKYHLAFSLASDTGDLINNDIPLDPPIDNIIRLSKSVEKPLTKVGDLIAYQLNIENLTSNSLPQVSVSDLLPQGFSLAKGSQQLFRTGADNILGTDDDLVEPIEVNGQQPIALAYFSLAANETVTISYLLRVGATATAGSYKNTAQPYVFDVIAGNKATASVEVVADSLFDGTAIIGKVFHDRDEDGYQDPAGVDDLRVNLNQLAGMINQPIIIHQGKQVKPGKVNVNVTNTEASIFIDKIAARHSPNDNLSDYQVDFQFTVAVVDITQLKAAAINITTEQGWNMTVPLNGAAIEYQHSDLVADGLSSQNIEVNYTITELNNDHLINISVVNKGIEERGLPGVRLATAKGLLVETDRFGRYHIATVDISRWERGQNFILKVDEHTLPEGSYFTTENPKVQRVSATSLAMMDFGVQLPKAENFVTSEAFSQVLGRVYFDSDLAALTTSTKIKIKALALRIADLEQQYNHSKVNVIGKADERHSTEYNLELAARRAINVLKQLKNELGILDVESLARYEQYQTSTNKQLQSQQFNLAQGHDLCVLDGEILGQVAEVDNTNQLTQAGRCVELARKKLKLAFTDSIQVPWVEWYVNGEQLGISSLENKTFPHLKQQYFIGIAGVDNRLRPLRGASQNIHLMTLSVNVNFNEAELLSAVMLNEKEKLSFQVTPIGEIFPRENGLADELSYGYLSKDRNDSSDNIGSGTGEGIGKRINDSPEEVKSVNDRRANERVVEVSYKGRVNFATGAAIWLNQDPAVVNPRLSIAGPETVTLVNNLAAEPLQFRVYNNYSHFIHRWQLAIYHSADTDLINPIKTFSGETLSREHKIIWQDFSHQKKLTRNYKDEYLYVMRVYDEKGDMDETYPQTIKFYHDDNNDRNLLVHNQQAQRAQSQLALDQRNDLLHQRIVIHGSRIRITGIDIDPANQLLINKEDVYVDQQGKFAIEMLLPNGKFTLPVQLIDDERSYHQQLEVNVTDSYFFMVALADITASKAKVSSNVIEVELADRFDEDVYVDGRLAFYLKGKIQGKYLLTAQLDTTEDQLSEIFTDLHKKDAKSLFRRFDPDAYYPVYGDESTTYADVNSQGRMYLRLDWDKSQVIWGNYTTGFTGSELAIYNRSLYGLKVHYQDTETTSYNKAKIQLQAFASEPGTLLAHNEFLATGGSLYYLRHKDVVQGSEKLLIEVREADTEQIIEHIELVAGVDYEFDFIQGRILLNTPLTQLVETRLATIIRSQPLLGDSVYLLADYEYIPNTSLSELTTGGRGKVWLTDNIALGATIVDIDREANGVKLHAVDATLQLGKGSYIKAEYAQTQASLVSQIDTSVDGGLTFVSQENNTSSQQPNQQGSAQAINVRVNLAELTENALQGNIDAWLSNKEQGFSQNSQTMQSDRQEKGVQARIILDNGASISTRISSVEQQQQYVKNVALINASLALSESLSVSGEYKHEQGNTTINGVVEQREADLIGVRSDFNFDDNISLYGIAQTDIDSNNNYANNQRFTLGSLFKINKDLSGNLEVSDGDRGLGTLAGLSYQLNPSNEIYTGYQLTTDSAYQAKSITTLGNRRRFGDNVSAFTEGQFLNSHQETGVSNVFGIDYQWSEHWLFSSTLQISEIDKITNDISVPINRKSASVAVRFKDLISSGSSRIEYRQDQGINKVEQWLVANQWLYLWDEELTFSFRFNWSDSDTALADAEKATFTEASLGFAYRPVEQNRWNMIGQYTYLYDLDGYNQWQSSSDQRSHVVSLEGLYRLNHTWLIGGKTAYRKSERRLGRSTGPWFSNDVVLFGVKGNYHLTYDWDFSLEYRWLVTPDAEGNQSGSLITLSKAFTEQLNLGIGYNFTSFSDDLTHLDYDVSGWFLNLHYSY